MEMSRTQRVKALRAAAPKLNITGHNGRRDMMLCCHGFGIRRHDDPRPRLKECSELCDVSIEGDFYCFGHAEEVVQSLAAIC